MDVAGEIVDAVRKPEQQTVNGIEVTAPVCVAAVFAHRDGKI